MRSFTVLVAMVGAVGGIFKFWAPYAQMEAAHCEYNVIQNLFTLLLGGKKEVFTSVYFVLLGFLQGSFANIPNWIRNREL